MLKTFFGINALMFWALKAFAGNSERFLHLPSYRFFLKPSTSLKIVDSFSWRNVPIDTACHSNSPAKARQIWSSNIAVFLIVLGSWSWRTVRFSTPNTTTSFPLTPTWSTKSTQICWSLIWRGLELNLGSVRDSEGSRESREDLWVERKMDRRVDLIEGWEGETYSTSTLTDSFQSVVDLEERERDEKRGGDEGQRLGGSRWSSKAARRSR